MSSEPLLPPRVVRMGEALRPLLSKVAERTAAPAGAGAAEPATMEFLSHRLQDLEMAATRLKAVVEAMMADVVENEDAADSDVYRAVARLESRVDDLVDDRARLRRRAAGEFAEGACLLAGVYDGLLGRIETWLEDLVESIADPLAAIERKGLPTSGYVELPLTLNIGAPERVAEFPTLAGPGEPPAGDRDESHVDGSAWRRCGGYRPRSGGRRSGCLGQVEAHRRSNAGRRSLLFTRS